MSIDFLRPTDTSTITNTPIRSSDTSVRLANLRGKDDDDLLWEKPLNNLTLLDYQQAIILSNYGTSEITSVGNPLALGRVKNYAQKDLQSPEG